MASRSGSVRVICLNTHLAELLRPMGVEMLTCSGKQFVYDLGPGLYVHAPPLVVASYPKALTSEPLGLSDDEELRALFDEALEKAGAQPLGAQDTVSTLVPGIHEAVATGHILAVVFVEKVPVDYRLALLPWVLWRWAKQAEREGAIGRGDDVDEEYHRRLVAWRRSWRVPENLISLAPVQDYTSLVLADLLPVWDQVADPWPVELPSAPSFEELRRKKVAEEQSYGDFFWPGLFDEDGAFGLWFDRRSPGFHLWIPGPVMDIRPAADCPAWARALLPKGLQTRARIQCVEWPSRDDPVLGRLELDQVEDFPTETEWERPASIVGALYGSRLPGTGNVDVEICPLYEDGAGWPLGYAVRIGRGAVLVLPECKDLASKARVVRLLVTELWKSVQEWLHGASATSAEATEKPAHINSEGAPESREALKQDEAGKLARLEKDTPAFDRDSGEWVKNTDAASIESVESATLGKYRTNGIRNADGTLGRDPDGRVWRRPGTKRSHPWYLKSTLLSVTNSAKNRQDG